jgi:hypothetical protein
MNRRTLVFALLCIVALAAGAMGFGHLRAQALGTRNLDDVYFIRYVCVPDVGPGGDALVDAIGTGITIQFRTSVDLINTTSVPIDYNVRFSGPDGIAGTGFFDTLAAGEATAITCQDIAQDVGTQSRGEGYVLLRVHGGGLIVSSVYSGYGPDLDGGGGLSFEVRSRLQPERAGLGAFF